jgi:hypothetical protein
LRRPKGKFGDVTNLERVARDPKVVVPFKPEESKLWALVNDGKMPPKNAGAGPLTKEEKDLIRAWIASGAPVASPPSGPTAPVATTPGEPRSQDLPPPWPFTQRLLRWLGKFHILVAHFPIALALAAALAEMGCLWRRVRGPWVAVRFCALGGAAGAVGAAVLGWLHAEFGGYGADSPELLALHRWTGTVAALWAVAVALLSEVETRRGRRSWLFRIALGVGALLIGATGHFGGTLVHGDEFFRW